jgi:hypothetical protein
MEKEESQKIQGGFVLISRRLLESGIMDTPHFYLKLWVWMLLKANFSGRGNLQRGQFYTTIAEMQKATAYKAGFRPITPTKDEIRGAYNYFRKEGMVEIEKATRGMIITITNYEKYQDPSNYQDQPKPKRPAVEKPAPAFLPESTEHKIASHLLTCIKFNRPNIKEPNLQTWAKEIDLMIRLDKRDPAEIFKIIEWCQQDSFWSQNILSTNKLRQHYDKLALKAKNNGNNKQNNESGPAVSQEALNWLHSMSSSNS